MSSNHNDNAGGKAGLNLQDFLPYRLSILSETVSQSLSQLYNERYGIAIPEWRVIAILGQYGTVTAKQIGACSRMHKTKVSRAVSTLEKRGLVERILNDDDMREAFVSLSKAGRAIYADITPAATEFSNALLGALSEEERDHLEAILNRLNEHALQLADDIAGGRALNKNEQ
jgi:DNA-binding MarR family transcriptional regulator